MKIENNGTAPVDLIGDDGSKTTIPPGGHVMRELAEMTRKQFAPLFVENIIKPSPLIIHLQRNAPPPLPRAKWATRQVWKWQRFTKRASDAWRCLRGTHWATDGDE